jgi:diadenosine tetraphosphate (Ap4A) HIT family hydrolase
VSYSGCVSACPYCSSSPEDAWIVSDDAIAVPHPNPLTAWHIVIAPRRHVAGFYDLDVQEQTIVWNLVGLIRNRIAASLKVEGFDIGFEDGSPDDENPAHAIVHVVPRTGGAKVKLPAGIEWVDGSQ